MDVIIQSLGFKASDALESFIQEKLAAIKSDRIVRANVTLFKGPEGNAEKDYCEIRLEVPGNDLFVKKQGAYFETAVTECIEVLTQQVQKEKDKHIGNRHAEAVTIQDAALAADDDDSDVELEDVVK